MAERGRDFAVMERHAKVTDHNGKIQISTNRYTVLNNGMHYQEDGVWKESRDVIEVFPEGAVARQGPNPTIFSPDLNVPAVFDMQTSEGARIRGGVRSIQFHDISTGAIQIIAQVKDQAPGELLPPNRIVYRDAFDGIHADVVYVWKHNLFSQNVILRQRPRMPEGMDPRSVRLEVITEIVEGPQPQIRTAIRRTPNGDEFVDDFIIRMGSFMVVPGKAIPSDNGAFSVDSPAFLRKDGLPVAKEWFVDDQENRFLIESVNWTEALPSLLGLPERAQAESGSSTSGKRVAARSNATKDFDETDRKPMKVASLDYKPNGFLIDVTSLPATASSYTFNTGETYLVTDDDFYVGDGNITFNPGCVIKSTDNAYFLTYGPLYFPDDTLQKVVFTSENDNGFGETISGSSGTPNYDADPALMVYYVDFSNKIENAWFRWANTAVEFYTNSGDPAHEIENCLFQNCDTGIYVDTYSEVDLVNSEKCDVNTESTGSGTVNYSLGTASNCIDYQFLGLENYSKEYYNFHIQIPPDTMGAVGTNYFVEILNYYIAVFDKDDGTNIVDEMELHDFFDHGSSHQVIDSRIVYDFDSEKWIACAADKGGTNLVLAISNGHDPSDLENGWTTFVKSADLDNEDFIVDYPTLGVDENGVYIVMQYKDAGPANIAGEKSLFVISKSDTTNLTSVTTNDIQRLEFTVEKEVMVQATVNFDDIDSTDPAWFIAKGPPTTNSYSPGEIHFFRVDWPMGNPNIVTNSWGNPYTPATTYYDLDLNNFPPPQLGGGENIELTGSPLMMAFTRDGYLWTCHHVGLDGTDGDYDGGADGSSVDRTGIQWFKFQTGATNLTHSASGLLYDDDREPSEKPYWYFFPSLTVNPDNKTVVASSGARANEYYGAFYWVKPSSGSFSEPRMLTPGGGKFTVGRWGDYSYTSIDPEGAGDDYIWTVQQYSVPSDTDEFGTIISKIKLD